MRTRSTSAGVSHVQSRLKSTRKKFRFMAATKFLTPVMETISDVPENAENINKGQRVLTHQTGAW